MSVYSIMIIDEHPIYRYGLRHFINVDEQFEVTAECCNCSEAVYIANELQPNIIMIDTNIHGEKTFETMRLLRKRCIQSYLLVFSLSIAKTDIYDAVDAGAQGYLLKNSELDMLMNSVRRAAEGHHVFSEKVYQRLLNRHQNYDPLTSLTRREKEVLHKMATGLKNKEISKLLFISEETVKVHIRNLLKKLNVRSRLEASLIYMNKNN